MTDKPPNRSVLTQEKVLSPTNRPGKESHNSGTEIPSVLWFPQAPGPQSHSSRATDRASGRSRRASSHTRSERGSGARGTFPLQLFSLSSVRAGTLPGSPFYPVARRESAATPCLPGCTSRVAAAGRVRAFPGHRSSLRPHARAGIFLFSCFSHVSGFPVPPEPSRLSCLSPLHLGGEVPPRGSELWTQPPCRPFQAVGLQISDLFQRTLRPSFPSV